jgi:hypothetical protein
VHMQAEETYSIILEPFILPCRAFRVVIYLQSALVQSGGLGPTSSTSYEAHHRFGLLNGKRYSTLEVAFMEHLVFLGLQGLRRYKGGPTW